MNEVVREFLLESHESLAQLDLDLVTLEKEPTDRETLARAFRTWHTIKGTSGFLGLERLQGISHAAEGLLSRLRDSELTFNPEIAGTLLRVVDTTRQILSALEHDGDEGRADDSPLISALDRLKQTGGLGGPAAPTPTPVPAAADPQPELTIADVEALPEPPTAAPEPVEPRGLAVAESAVRVDVGLLDTLMNLVGEMVLARNQIVQFSTSQADAAFLGTVQRLSLLTTELQANVMKTRMQPIGTLWSKFPRIVRDLAVACGKRVRVELDGRETELDRTIVETIRDPLTHMVRNAVDHGIEPPEERRRLGKPAEGRLALHAAHEGGKVIVRIADDGAGIDPRRVRAKAIAAGLISAEQADRLGDRELVNLVFHPGFSTADRVTHFSGRGVGMDVVRANVEKIGGTVDLESQPGRGTTVTLKIPLTLAIIPALVVADGGDRYAIPQVSLLELVRLEGEQAVRGIERIQGAPVYRLRGRLLPLVYLHRELRTSSRGEPGVTNVVVLQADDRPFGLVVDEVQDTAEIVVKPLQRPLKALGVFAGATIMGDGKVALILDVLGLAQRARVIAGARERALAEATAEAAEAAVERQVILLVADRDDSRLAIPLARVARLEEFPDSSLERVGDRQVVQYRGEILPLVDVAGALRRLRPRRRGADGRARRPTPGPRPPRPIEAETVQVVVTADLGRPVGLVVGRIIDIVEEALAVTGPAHRPGILRTAVVQGRVTEFLDVEAILRAAANLAAAPEPEPLAQEA